MSIDATEVTRGRYLQFTQARPPGGAAQPSKCSWNRDYTPDLKRGGSYEGFNDPDPAQRLSCIVGDAAQQYMQAPHIGFRCCGN